MKSISSGLEAAFSAHLAGPAVCLKMTRADSVVVAATNHDEDLVVGGVTYLSSAGGTETDVETTAALNVDNASQDGILNLDSITEDDLHAGLYDNATVSLFKVNFYDLTQGEYRLRDGWLGQVATERDSYTAELRGVAQAIQVQFGATFNPLCPYNLGDFPFPAPGRGRCTVDLTGSSPDSPSVPYTVTGTLTGVGADQVTLFDTSRMEPGPAVGASITGITTANPGHVTLATALGLPSGSTIIISGVVGMGEVNTVTVAENVASDGLSFDLPDDTTEFQSYISGGTVTPLGGDSGWFDAGLFTVTSGPNSGTGRGRIEVKAYVPGQWVIQQPFYYPLVGNETYTMVVGCNKAATTCKTKFNNLVNHGGFEFVPGQDKIIQIAQPQSGQTAGKKG